MISHLTPEELVDFEAAFNSFDKDGDGVIDATDLGIMMRSFGQVVTDEQLRDVVLRLDLNGSGAIEFSEFVSMMRQRERESDGEQEIREAFAVFDRDGNGFISAQELRSAMSKFGEQVTPAEVDDMIRLADLNNDGFVNIDEFVKLFIRKD
ncbi:calmodulin [Auriculariales sp. MPI-PUGE-AT-0066]|nr:calmodulin [Auriculariales sp. MPI-PUGE-AT-0066]